MYPHGKVFSSPSLKADTTETLDAAELRRKALALAEEIRNLRLSFLDLELAEPQNNPEGERMKQELELEIDKRIKELQALRENLPTIQSFIRARAIPLASAEGPLLRKKNLHALKKKRDELAEAITDSVFSWKERKEQEKLLSLYELILNGEFPINNQDLERLIRGKDIDEETYRISLKKMHRRFEYETRRKIEKCLERVMGAERRIFGAARKAALMNTDLPDAVDEFTVFDYTQGVPVSIQDETEDSGLTIQEIVAQIRQLGLLDENDEAIIGRESSHVEKLVYLKRILSRKRQTLQDTLQESGSPEKTRQKRRARRAERRREKEIFLDERLLDEEEIPRLLS